MKRFLLSALACSVSALSVSLPAAEPDSEALIALVQVLAATEDVQFQLDVLKGMNDGLKGRRGVKMPAGWEELATKLAKSPSAQVRELAQSLSLTFGSGAALAALKQALMDPKADVTTRKTALDSLMATGDPSLASSLHRLLKDPVMRAGALRGLAAYEDEKTPGAILEIYSSLTGAEKRDALNTLVSRATFAKPLLAAIAGNAVPRKDLTADIVRQLRNLRNPDLNEQVEKLWGVARESEGDKLKEIAKYKALLASKGPGDPPQGRAIFARICQQCHTLFDVGGKVGPDITGSNRGDLDYILQNVLDPNAVIPNDYRTSNLETKDERVITGIVTRQDDNAVTIITANESITVPRSDIKSLSQNELSMMPEGLLQQISDDEVRDLVAYLKQPSQVPMLATPDNVGSFFNGKDLTGWDGNVELWHVQNGEIVGRTRGLKENEWLAGPLLLGDFRFICKVKLKPNKENSGIQFRSQRLPSREMKGYQADIGAGWWGKLYEEHGRGLLWKDSDESAVKPDEWNTYELLAVGNKIRTAINGKLCVDIEDASGSKSGVIAFQLHAGGAMEVRFKDFQLELNPKFTLATLK